MAPPSSLNMVARDIAWNQVSGGGAWAMNCDWNGSDLSNVKVSGDQCGSKCSTTGGCTHFTWTNLNGGTCWMKSGPVTASQAIVKTNDGAVCGYIKSDAGGSSSSGISWNYGTDGSYWGLNCDWPGQDFASSLVTGAQCGQECRNKAGCTHFTWTNYNGGTCWMKNGNVNQNQAVAKDSASCGTIVGGGSTTPTQPDPPAQPGKTITSAYGAAPASATRFPIIECDKSKTCYKRNTFLIPSWGGISSSIRESGDMSFGLGRFYLVDPNGSVYKQFYLNNKQIVFNVDVSGIKCGKCMEMDIFEGNIAGTQLTTHECKNRGQVNGNQCNHDGCSDRSSTKWSDKVGPRAYIDTLKPFKVTTKFYTNDNSDNGALKSIVQAFEQEGRYYETGNINSGSCTNQWGGVQQMGVGQADGDASTPLLNTPTKTNNEKTRRFNDMTFGAICVIVGAGIGSVITFLATKGQNSIESASGGGIISSALNWSSDPVVHVPGWMAERLFHSNAIVCPWTNNPLNDTDCQFRRSEINRMRDAISLCNDPLARNFETIGHRGAPLVAPEETLRSYEIAVDSGAGFIECDASVTKEMDLICRHSVCDLHYTTDILMHHPDLAAKCSSPFTPATNTTKANATCCTFDFTLQEMKQLCATMESDLNPNATRVQDYVLGKPAFRSIGVRDGECVKMVSMKEFLEFAKTKKRVNVIPELKDTTEHSTMSFLKSKGASIETLADLFAKNLRDAGFSAPFDKTYKDAGKKGTLGIMQTFDRRVAKIWKQNNKDLPVLYLIQSPMNTTTTEKDCVSASDCGTPDVLRNLMKLGVELFAPALNGLVTAKNHRYVEHQYSQDIKALAEELGLKDKVFLGSWSLERSACVSQYGDGSFNAEAGLGAIGGCGWYYNSVEGYASFGQHEDALLMMDALFTKAGVVSLFSDFPATVSMYSNCVLKRD
ncbi:hypothetical protein CcCBS67573_g04745 [Chytriomyces confervae]|uniref:glycerophosphodiester phosphodiesterase n=1 Tax=Chytriomyces confervae TaxID=246404 RepID=A0A507FCD4_9FUNG|nr:hypothetical protein CcCBS67573_g04745 [Chytriomyces confervae]